MLNIQVVAAWRLMNTLERNGDYFVFSKKGYKARQLFKHSEAGCCKNPDRHLATNTGFPIEVDWDKEMVPYLHKVHFFEKKRHV